MLNQNRFTINLKNLIYKSFFGFCKATCMAVKQLYLLSFACKSLITFQVGSCSVCWYSFGIHIYGNFLDPFFITIAITKRVSKSFIRLYENFQGFFLGNIGRPETIFIGPPPCFTFTCGPGNAIILFSGRAGNLISA